MAFTPTNITGLAAWFDASDATTMFTDAAGTTPVSSDEDVVQNWTDKSGNMVVVTEATNPPAYRTNVQNSLSVIRFDGVNDTLAKGSGLFGGAITTLGMLIVGKQTMHAGKYMASITGAAHLALFGTRESYWGCYLSAAGATDLRKLDKQLLSNDATAFHCMAILWRSRDLFLSRLDGKESQGRTYDVTGTPSLKTYRPNPVGAMTLTANLSFGSVSTTFRDCDIAEVLIYTGDEIFKRYQEVESFLFTKWGLAYTTEQV